MVRSASSMELFITFFFFNLGTVVVNVQLNNTLCVKHELLLLNPEVTHLAAWEISNNMLVAQVIATYTQESNTTLV